MMRWVGTLDIDKSRATTNRAPGRHWTDRAEMVREVRGAFALLCSERGNRAPRFTTPVVIEVQVECARNGTGRRVDTDAGYAAAKACVDGLRDARVISNDTADWVRWIRHHAPVWSPDNRDAITLIVETAPNLDTKASHD